MKNLKTIFAFLIACTFMLVGCADFADTPGKSVWSEGMWIIPWLTGVGSVIFFYQAYRGSKSGSNIIKEGRVTDEEGGNVPIYKFGFFWFGVALAVATGLIILNVISEK